MIPASPDYVPGKTAAATVAVMRGARTVREVAAATGVAVVTAHVALVDAVHWGLLVWAESPDGQHLPRTLRPAVRVVRL